MFDVPKQTDNGGNSLCKICKVYNGKALGRHIAKSVLCKEGYGEKFKEMKAQNEKSYKAMYYKKNASKIKGAQASYNSENRDEISQRKKINT